MTARCTLPPTGPAAEAAAFQAACVPVLETARLRLRAPTLDDLPDWTRVFIDAFAEPGDAPDRPWAEFSYYTAGWMLHGHGLWTVERRSDCTRVGFVMVGLEWGDEEPELGYMTVPEHRGQGYATEAARAARNWGLRLLPTIVSYVDPGNAASNRIAERLGAERDTAAGARLAARDGEPVNVWRHMAPANGGMA
jgi:RimJ/RimL family protein N-acetyltransferase